MQEGQMPYQRTLAQLQNHYAVEKALASKLKNAPRAERPLIYATMYEELFAKVPDHPRLVKRGDPLTRGKRIRRALRLVQRAIGPSTVFLEFGPGDCRFAFAVCTSVQKVYGVDISQQMSRTADTPSNFELIVYDGYQVPLANNSIDVMFSDQLIEHLHQEDTSIHFQIAQRLLRRGGRYIFTTPHRFSGPHDISRYFSDEAEGFHLKEWTYRDLIPLLRAAGFVGWKAYRFVKGFPVRFPGAVALRLEAILEPLERQRRRRISRRLLPHIILSAAK